MVDYEDLILTTVIPTIGVMTSNFIYFSSMKSVLEVHKAQVLGNINVYCFPLICLNGGMQHEAACDSLRSRAVLVALGGRPF